MQDIKNLTDEELIFLVRTQNQEFYSEVVKRYQEKLLRYATYLIKDANESADVVQEAFIKAFVNLNGFNINKKFSSWIYRIVHNEAINFIKKRKKEISLETNSYLSDVLSENDSLELGLERKEIKQKIRKCLAFLPIKYREPLVLFFLEERSYEEISDILRIPIGTVGTRINRGKKIMKQVYQQKNFQSQSKIKKEE